jgi:hypothetical protein
MTSALHTAEGETIAQLLADEATLQRELAEARAAAGRLVDAAKGEAAALRESGRAAVAEEVRERLASDSGGGADGDAADEIHAETAALLADLRRRASDNRDRALALVIDLVTGRVPP